MSTRGAIINDVGRSAGAPVNNVAPGPLARPTGPGGTALRAGDVIILVVTIGTAAATDGAASSPGFVQRGIGHDQGTPGVSTVLLTKTVTDPTTEPSTYTVTVTGLNSSNKALAAIWVERGLKTTALGDVAFVAAATTSGTARGPASLTLAGAGKTWRLIYAAADRGAGTFSVSNGDTELVDYNSGTNPNTAHAIYTPAADVGPGTYSKTVDSTASSSVGLLLIGAFETQSTPPTGGRTITGGYIKDTSTSVAGALTFSAFSTSPSTEFVADYAAGVFAVKQGESAIAFQYTVTDAGGLTATVTGTVSPLAGGSGAGQMESLVMIDGVLT